MEVKPWLWETAKEGCSMQRRLKARTWCRVGWVVWQEVMQERSKGRLGLGPMGRRHGLGEYPEGPWLWKWNSGA